MADKTAKYFECDDCGHIWKQPKREAEDGTQSAFRALQHVIETTEGTSAKPAKKEPRKPR